MNYFSFIVFYSFAVLIWEPVVFFSPFILAIEIIENKTDSVRKLLFTIIKFFPGIFIAIYIATNPIWKIPYNASKKILGFDNLRLFQDNSFIKWHKKYIE